MNRRLRKSLKWILWIVIFFLFLVVVQVSVLAFPSPWFDEPVKKGNLKIYSKGIPGVRMESIASEVQERIEAVEIYERNVDVSVFICPRPRLYSVFARLSLVPTHVPGFNLSLFNNTFVSIPILDARRAGAYGHIEHSALAGDLEQCIAHELVHEYTQEKIGFFAYRRIPTWKTEGYAEYCSSKALLDEEGATPLKDRIGLLETEFYDAGARGYYRWSLIVEYLSTVRGYSFNDIMDEGVTLAVADADMMSWYGR